MRRRAWLPMIASLLILAPATARAQQPSPPTGKELDELTARVASELRCPVCRQLSIDDSQSDLANEARGVIREKLAAGQTPEEVKAYFVSKYGEWILLSPPKTGFTLLVWVLPLAALLGGGGVLAYAFRTWLPAAGSDPAPTEPEEART